MFMAIAIACMSFFVGCTPSEETIVTSAKVSGYTAGMVIGLTKTDGVVKENITKILDITMQAIPQPGQSFSSTWKTIIKDLVTDAVKTGKINEDQSKFIVVAGDVVCEALDYLTKKHPVITEKKDLLSKVLTSFYDGLKTTMTVSASKDSKPEMDEELYNHLKASMKK